MKRLSMAMTALAVMGLMTMVSCRKPNVNNVVPGAARTVTFNAATESGNGSKTTLVGLDVKWSADDKISVNGNDANHTLTLEDGAGTTFGRFTGTITAAAPYLVGYPADATNNGSQITFTIDAEQKDNDASLTGVLPMAAYTTDENADLAFKNMANVLKLDLTGSQAITKIEVESTENLSGTFTVGTGLTPNRITSGTKKITVTKNMTLTGTPQTVYVVLPVFGSAESTVTVKFTGAAGVMTVGPKALTGSTTPNHRYSAGVNVLLETPWSAEVTTIPVCAVHKNCASSGGVVTGTGVEEQGVCWGTDANPTIAGSHYVHQYEYANGSLTPKNTTTDNTFTGFMSGLTPGETYHVRAYIRRGSKVIYGDDIEFPTPSAEPFPTGAGSTVNFDLADYPDLEWSKYNLGVDPNDLDEAADWYGDWYQWGDLAACSTISSGTTYYVNCGWQSYRYAANSTTTFTKYCPSDKTGYWYNYSAGTNDPDGKESLGSAGDHYNYADDCVRRTLGGTWRMPTGGAVNTTTGAGEWQALYNGTLWVWTDHYDTKTDLKGYVVYKVKAAGHKAQRKTSDGDGDGGYAGYSGSGYTYTLADTHMFLPAAGSRNGTSLNNAGSYGYYWSSSLLSSYPYLAYGMYFRSGYVSPQDYYYRCYGFSVRPVQ